jgi:hypothetical protein
MRKVYANRAFGGGIAPAISVAGDGDWMTGAMHPIRFSLARPETPA